MKSIEQIARLAGVSKTTVSLVINNKHLEHRISPATVDKVMAVVNRHAFLPNQFARSFRLKTTRTIGLVVGDVTNAFFSLIEKSVEQEAKAQGFNLIIASSNDEQATEQAVIESLLRRSIDGLIVVSVFPKNNVHEKVNKGRTPIIYIDRKVEGRGAVSVVSDNRDAACKLTGHWLDKGFRKIAYIGGNPLFQTHAERLKGFRLAHEKHKVPLTEKLIFEGHFTPDSGYTSMEQLASLDIVPDAVFAASFTLLQGVLRYMHKHAPETLAKVKLGSFDDHPLLDFLRFPVDSIAQDCTRIGKESFFLLRKMMDGNRSIKSLVIKSKLIYRD